MGQLGLKDMVVCVSCFLEVAHCLTPCSPQPSFEKAGHRKKRTTDVKSIQLAIQNISVVHIHAWFLLVVLGIAHP